AAEWFPHDAAAAQGNGLRNAAGQPAKAILKCRPNSHPFQNRTLLLEPNQEVKVGRSVPRHRVAENNAIFDCKVLSRNHAVLWYSDGKFFIRDTGSSNGTFINNQRLSPMSHRSDPFEVSSGDIVQFGVDVTENSRKETHGCIVATLKLFLPDGRETKASQSTCVGEIPPEDLHRLNQYVQEMVQREQMLESKLMDLQKILELSKANAESSWQAMIDEDRLLNRIDILENKLQCYQKGITEDKLREEVQKLQEDKLLYQDSAKEALRKVYQERYEAIQKLAGMERALSSSEDECSVLKEQAMKAQSELRDTLSRFNTLQQKYDELAEKFSQLESQVAKNQPSSLIQAPEGDSEGEKNMNDKCPEENSAMKEALRNLFAKSDLKNLEGSEDIIKSMFNDTDSNDDLNNVQVTYSRIYDRLLELERNFTLSDNCNPSTVKQEHVRRDSECSVDSNSSTETTVSDGNQNVNEEELTPVHKRMISTTIGELKEIYSDLMSNVATAREDVVARKESKERCEEMEAKLVTLQADLQTLSLELQTRPTYNQYHEKVKLCDDLQTEVALFQSQIAGLREAGEKLGGECEVLRQQLAVIRDTVRSDKAAQTDELEAPVVKVVQVTTMMEKDAELSQEIQLITDPEVQREEELVLYKEKFAQLSEESIRMRQELESVRRSYDYLRNKSLITLLTYLVPFVALISYFLFTVFS
ncbi:sarcolemmal membrane-associated protein, partial [Phlebotomus argentipes]|uniref:sarcolemmal membrane-associated protein n=1 Tax=Phlebotomus argentipes TaxID=94469 RepID=UPI002892DC16